MPAVGLGRGAAHVVAGGGAAFNPADYGTVAWWLRGDDVTLNGADVASWNDKSGNARHFAQGTPSVQPLYVASAINGMPGVQFDASNSEQLDGPNLSLEGLTAAETFLVMQLNADPSVAGAGGSGGIWLVGVGSGGGSVVPFTNGTVYDSFGSSARKTTVNPAGDMASPCIYNVVSVSGEWTNFLNNTQLYTTGTNTVGFRNGTSQLGASLGAGLFLDGIVCEWLTYDAKLSAPNKAAVVAYLAARYNITVA